MPAEPKCPSCGVTGIQHIKSRESVERSKSQSPWFFVVYCDQCGHIHDIIAKHVFSQGKSSFMIRT